MKAFYSGFCLLASGFWFSSCVVYQHEAISKSGNYERDLYASLGGSASLKGADSSSLVHDHNDSFSRGVTAAESYAAAKVASTTTQHVTDSNNAADLAKVQSNNATTVQQAQISADASAKTGQQANFGKLIDVGAFAKDQALPAATH